MDPAKRIALFEDWGARQVPVDYIQPPLSEDGCYSDNMVLLNYPVEGKYAGRKEVEAFLRGIYREFRSDKAPEEDYFFRQMKRQLRDNGHEAAADCHLPGYMRGTPKFMFLV
jgi:hypothetical protein